jgi:transposase-like protein
MVSKRQTNPGRVRVVGPGAVPDLPVSPDDPIGAMASVLLQHDDFPGLRFLARIGENGRVVGWSVADWRFLRHPAHKEPPASDPAWGPLAAIGATVMRTIPFGELEREARICVSGLALYHLFPELSEPDEHFSKADFDRLGQLGDTVLAGSPRQGGRQAHDDLFYAQVAKAYVDLKSSTPVADLAREQGYSRNTVANWLTEARGRKLLTETDPGRAGGVLTAKAKQLLRTTAKNAKREAAKS